MPHPLATHIAISNSNSNPIEAGWERQNEVRHGRSSAPHAVKTQNGKGPDVFSRSPHLSSQPHVPTEQTTTDAVRKGEGKEAKKGDGGPEAAGARLDMDIKEGKSEEEDSEEEMLSAKSPPSPGTLTDNETLAKFAQVYLVSIIRLL